MWTLITSKEQFKKLKKDDLVLQHPSNDEESLEKPTGQESNSNVYRVHSMTASEIILESLPQNYILGQLLISSMKRPVNGNQLLNGKWWINNEETLKEIN